MSETRRSFCRICVALCGIEAEVDGGQVGAIRGDASHPFSKGYLCPKGRALAKAHDAPSRLSGAYLGRGAQRRQVTIEEGHADLADALSNIIAEHGRGSIGVFHGTGAFADSLGNFAARKFAKALGSDQVYSTATLDAMAKTLVAGEMAGTPLLMPNIDEESGRLLVFVGINPVVSHGHATMFPDPISRLRAARQRGPVFTLDPRATETARLSDHHLALRPATDFAVFAHVIRELFARGVVDETALATRASGADELRSIVARFDAATVAAFTGLREEQLKSLVDAVQEAGRLAILTGTGSSMSPTANLGEWMAWALMVVTDSFDRPGGMWFNPGLFARFDRFDTLPRVAPAEPAPPTRPDVSRCGGEWPASLICDEIESGRLRALIVFGGNLVTAIPDAERLAAALAGIDVLVVLDVVHTTTTDLATHVFATAGQLERPDIISLETTAAFRYQHYTDAVVPAPPDRPEMWRTVARIGAGIGVDVLRNRHTVLDPESATPDDVFAMLVRGDGVARLRDAGGLQVEGGPAHDWVRPRLPNGRWNLVPDRLVDQMTREVLEPRDLDQLVLTPRRLVKRMNWQVFREGETNEALLHPADAGRMGFADGDLVEIRTAIGAIRVPIRVTDTIVAGSVSVVHGFEDSNVNAILDRTLIDPLSGMVQLSAVPIALTRAPLSPRGS